jgi:uncharacterized protein (DUF488 family)
VIVHTVGHSTLSLGDFLDLLESHAIQTVADVRRFPASRRHPHFARESLARSLLERGISYEWVEALGGRRPTHPDSPHTAWRLPAFRGYADHMDTTEFQEALTRLILLTTTRPTTVLCAEAVPWRCHRQLMADALLARGIEVRHILTRTTAQPHHLTPFARQEGTRVIYDAGQPSLPTPKKGKR